MSANPTLPALSPSPRAAHSPQSPPLEYAEDYPDNEPGEQQQAGDAPDDEEDIAYPEPGPEQALLPPPNFRPFFTLIEDSTSGEHYHPYVHYVFADDDPTIVIAASMRGLGLDDTKYLPQDAQDGRDRRRGQDSEEGAEGDEQASPIESPVESPLPPSIPGVKDHYLIIDVGADGRTIVDAQSLSSEWQITDTGTRTAPSFDEDSPDQGYMLRIEGVGIPRKTKGKGPAGQDKLGEAREQHEDIFAALDGLVQGIDEELEVTRKISGVRPNEGEEGTVTDVREEDVVKLVDEET